MTNFCVECNIDLGEHNPRQYCAKTHCENKGMKFEYQPDWKGDLDTLGFAVVENVLDEKECEDLISGFWKFWNTLSKGGIKRHDKSTWKHIYKWFLNHGMLGQHFGIGHIPAIWATRGNERVIDVFETIWGTRDLTCSVDGASTSLQPEVTGRGWHRKDWLHLDQSPNRSDFECVQGWATGHAVEKGDGTLTVLEGSHLLHGEFSKHFGLNDDKKYRKDWFKLEQTHVDWYLAQGCTQRFVTCPKGSLVLWDSRTVHAGRAPVKGRMNPKNRIVAYISMMPKSMLSEKDAIKKRNAVLQGRMTTHWAASHVKLFNRLPRTYGHAIPEYDPVDPPFIPPRAAILAGWIDPAKCPFTISDPVARKIAVNAEITLLMSKLQIKRDANRVKKKRKASDAKDTPITIRFKS
jgi:hypothetical protein